MDLAIKRMAVCGSAECGQQSCGGGWDGNTSWSKSVKGWACRMLTHQSLHREAETSKANLKKSKDIF